MLKYIVTTDLSFYSGQYLRNGIPVIVWREPRYPDQVFIRSWGDLALDEIIRCLDIFDYSGWMIFEDRIITMSDQSYCNMPNVVLGPFQFSKLELRWRDASEFAKFVSKYINPLGFLRYNRKAIVCEVGVNTLYFNTPESISRIAEAIGNLDYKEFKNTTIGVK